MKSLVSIHSFTQRSVRGQFENVVWTEYSRNLALFQNCKSTKSITVAVNCADTVVNVSNMGKNRVGLESKDIYWWEVSHQALD